MAHVSYEPINLIKISLSFDNTVIAVGKMARRERKIYFEYDASFIERDMEVSPIRCPLKPGVQTFDPFLFEGLPGVFNDSLPDGWGRLLLDRNMRLEGIIPNQLSPLDRLAHVGHTGMGALIYEPYHGGNTPPGHINLDTLATHAKQVLEGEATDVLKELLLLNGSSAGARPKAMIGVSHNRKEIVHGIYDLGDGYDPWLVKFPDVNDGLDAGAIEYVYALMAKEAGLQMEDIHLFPSDKGPGFFATRRFDRRDGKRLHSHTACGLLHSDFRTPSLDYEDLIALTMILTRDIREAEKMYRLSVFNVLAHNRDDHAKNFSFLMDHNGDWKLSPAYDLTFSSGPRGEQSSMVMGEGKNPGKADLIRLGLEAKLPRKKIDEAIEKTKSAIGRWRELASTYGVGLDNIEFIASRIITSSSKA